MATALLNYLGYGEPRSMGVDKKPVRALPASWYTSQEMYELEKRAIYSRKWMLITHQSRISQPGDWLKSEVAGYEFVLSRNRESVVHAFHNVCRHRAFPVVQGEQGNSSIFACRYHGWSYSLDGRLAKAPLYDELDSLDRRRNGLFKIHVHVDVNGFIWINLDSRHKPEIAWEDDFAGIDTQERFKQYSFDDYVLDNVYRMDGAFNWKILADNFNECYHCPTTHPDVPTLADIQTHDVDTGSAWITHKSTLTEEQQKNGLGISSTYYFPNVSLSVLPHFIMLQRFLPSGPNSCTMEYQIFRNKKSSEEDFQLIHQMYKRIVAEDKVLCELAQKNLTRGIFTNGELHPRLEKGPLYFQRVAREVIREHYLREKEAKKQIWPARPEIPVSELVTLEDEELCSSLACETSQVSLAW